MSSRNPDSIAPWTAVWQFEAAGHRPARTEQDRVIEPAWHEFTDALADGTRLLDLATGNGVVALACARRAQRRKQNLEIHAVDAADIKPPAQASHEEPRVLFRGGVWLEELPFEDGEFGAVVSQYGFEYADEEQAVAETSRVLSPGGRLRLVIHAHGGAVWEDVQFRHDRLAGVLASDGVMGLVLGLVRARKNDEARVFKSRLKKLESAAREAQKLADNAPPDDTALFFSREFLYVWSNRNRYRLDDLLRSLEEGTAFARGTAERYAQMLKVARTGQQMAALGERLNSSGFRVTMLRQLCNPADGREIAWQIDAARKHP